MSKYCGNCGKKLDNTAKVCGNCGMPLEPVKNKSIFIPGVNSSYFEKKTKIKRIVKTFIFFLASIVVMITICTITSNFVGYKGTIRKIMNAYEKFDLKKIISLSSEFYYYVDDENYVEKYFGDTISDDLETFENLVGHDYKLTYEIIDNYKLPVYKYDDLLDTISNYDDFDSNVISDVMIVEINATAKGNDSSLTIELKIMLTKENGSWKLLYLQ